MTGKAKFIQELENYISHETTIPFSDEAWAYFQSLKATEEKEKPLFTENGAKVLQWMQDNYQTYNNIMNAKVIGEGMGTTSRAASGALRKLVIDGYVEKTAGQPVCYCLTPAGLNCVIPPVAPNED